MGESGLLANMRTSWVIPESLCEERESVAKVHSPGANSFSHGLGSSPRKTATTPCSEQEAVANPTIQTEEVQTHMTVRAFARRDQRDEAEDAVQSAPPRGSHLSSRTGLIALYAAFIAILAGILSFFGSHQPASSVVAAGIAFAGAFMFFDKIIGD